MGGGTGGWGGGIGPDGLGVGSVGPGLGLVGGTGTGSADTAPEAENRSDWYTQTAEPSGDAPSKMGNNRLITKILCIGFQHSMQRLQCARW